MRDTKTENLIKSRSRRKLRSNVARSLSEFIPGLCYWPMGPFLFTLMNKCLLFGNCLAVKSKLITTSNEI